MRWDSADIAGLAQRFRANLMNAVVGARPAVLVGTADRAQRSNLAIMSSALHLGSDPPLLGLITRPDPVPRHTLENLLDTGVWTLNHVCTDFVAAAHQTSARYPREQSEFAAVGLTERWEPGFAAPFVAESSVRIGLTLREHHPLACNGTHLLIGQVVLLDVPDIAVDEEGRLDLSSTASVCVGGLDSYYRAEPLARLHYAKPELPPRLRPWQAEAESPIPRAKD